MAARPATTPEPKTARRFLLNLTDGFAFYLARYGLESDHASVRHILETLGYLDDVAEDPYLEQSVGTGVTDSVTSYWRRRQPECAVAPSGFESQGV
ncbi:MAG: hypothetical protein OXG47_10295 [bacterium]|nr:hypothetical protein [bacterium]